MAPNAATLVHAAMKAVTGVGAPWYTSGVQEWNGIADTLNSRPTATIVTPTSSSGSALVRFAMLWAMSLRYSEPEKPNSSAEPNRKNADEKEPSRKYFRAAS